MVALSVHGDGTMGIFSSLSSELSVAVSAMVVYNARCLVDRTDLRAVKSPYHR